MKNKILRAVAVFLCPVIFIACSRKPEDVRLATEQEIQQYVEENIGGAVYVKKEEEENAIKYYFTDKQYGFTFWAKSLANPISIDDGVMGYSEVKADNYEEAYYQTIVDAVREDVEKLEQEYGFTTEWNTHINSTGFAWVRFEEARKADQEALAQFAALVVKHDARNYYDRLIVYEGKNNIGRYMIQESRFVSREELDQEEALGYAAEVCGQPVTYQYCEVRKVKDVPGVSDLDKDKDSSDYREAQLRAKEDTLVYFFEVDGRVYSVANLYGMNNVDKRWFCNYRNNKK